MMFMDKTSEKLRSKHVRTLELLQKTLDENVELRNQIGCLQKVNRRLYLSILKHDTVANPSLSCMYTRARFT